MASSLTPLFRPSRIALNTKMLESSNRCWLTTPSWIPAFRAVPFIMVPVSFGLAILRFRLFDIDRLIRRTLLYGLLSGLLGVVYFGSVLFLRQVLGGLTGNSSPALVLSTLLIAAPTAALAAGVSGYRRAPRSHVWWSAGIVLDADSTFLFNVISPGGDVETRTGTWRLDGDVLTVREEGTAFELRFDVAYTEPILRLTGADVEFDVNGDGSDEAADLNLELGR